MKRLNHLFVVLFLLFFAHSAFAKTAFEKLEQHWREMVYSIYNPSDFPDLYKNPNIVKALRGLTRKALRRTFENPGDTLDTAEIPYRFIHRFGAVAQVAWIPTGNVQGLTGVYAHGGVGLMRISSAMGDNIPGFGLKILRDGDEPSLNTMAMPGLDKLKKGEGFLDKDFRTTVGAPALLSPARLLEIPFRLAVKNPRILNVSHLSELRKEAHPENARVPPELIFKPTALAKALYRSDVRDYRLALGLLGSSIHLFDIYAVFEQSEVGKGSGEKIGEIKTLSPFIASEYGDRLQMRHFRNSYKNAFANPCDGSLEKPL